MSRRVLRRVVVVVCVVAAAAVGAVLTSAVVDKPSRQFQEAIVVEAPRAAIWAALTEFERYDEWNPYIRKASGSTSVGATVSLTIDGEDGGTSTRTAEVLILRPQRKLEWRTRVLAPGVLDREQIFRVVPLTPGRFRVTQESRVEGLLSPFADLDQEEDGLSAMLSALQERVERG